MTGTRTDDIHAAATTIRLDAHILLAFVFRNKEWSRRKVGTRNLRFVAKTTFVDEGEVRTRRQFIQQLEGRVPLVALIIAQKKRAFVRRPPQNVLRIRLSADHRSHERYSERRGLERLHFVQRLDNVPFFRLASRFVKLSQKLRSCRLIVFDQRLHRLDRLILRQKLVLVLLDRIREDLAREDRDETVAIAQRRARRRLTREFGSIQNLARRTFVNRQRRSADCRDDLTIRRWRKKVLLPNAHDPERIARLCVESLQIAVRRRHQKETVLHRRARDFLNITIQSRLRIPRARQARGVRVLFRYQARRRDALCKRAQRRDRAHNENDCRLNEKSLHTRNPFELATTPQTAYARSDVTVQLSEGPLSLAALRKVS